jgi:hypothetical protein
MTASPAKSPPYAAQIDRDGDLVMIYCGRSAWELAKPVGAERVASLVFPRNRDPADFNWPVIGKQVLVLAQDEEDAAVDLLAIELLRAGGDLVHVRYADERLETYDPKAERRKGA